jgi:hypothetical protein
MDMNTKEPKAGEYYYIALEFNDEIYNDKIIRLIKISAVNRRNRTIDNIVYLRLDINQINIMDMDDKYKKVIWLKQWKPNWFYRMTGY